MSCGRQWLSPPSQIRRISAPAVATIERLTNAWEEQNPLQTVKAVYAGSYQETTTKALTAAQAGDPPQVAVLLAIYIFTLIEEDVVLPISDIAASDDLLRLELHH